MAGRPLRVVLVQPWFLGVTGVRAALAAAGLTPWITRVDFEAALDAALSRGGIDLVILDPETPGLTRRVVESCMREHAIDAPLVELVALDTLGDAALAALAALRN